MIISLLLMVITVMIIGCSTNDKAESVLKSKLVAAEQLEGYVMTGDTNSLSSLFTDSLLTTMPVSDMAGMLQDLINENGTIAGTDGPYADSSGQVHFLIHFEQRSLAVWLEFDESQQISFVEIANAPIPEAAVSDQPLDHQHAHTLAIDLNSVAEFAAHFEAERSYVRLVTLLSPT